MQLHDVIVIVEELRHEGKLVGNGFRIAAAHARDAGAVLHVTSNRRVNVKKSNRPKWSKIREAMRARDPGGAFSPRSINDSVVQLNAWFKLTYGTWPHEADRAFGELGDFSRPFSWRKHMGFDDLTGVPPVCR